MPSRVFCPTCKDFTVPKTIGKCIECGAEKHRDYDYVPTDMHPHYTEIKPKEQDQNQLGLGLV